MIPWTDPLTWGAGVVLLFIAGKAARSLWKEIQVRRSHRLVHQRDARLLVGDYRARYGPQDAAVRLEDDLRATRSRVEELASRWKACQRKVEMAKDPDDARSIEAEERKTYEAFLAEGRRLKQLREAQDRLKRQKNVSANPTTW